MFRLWKSRLISIVILVLLSQACTHAQQTTAPTQAVVNLPTVTLKLEPTPVNSKVDNQTVEMINSIIGGEIALSTSNGDNIKLYIPPFALSENTEISLIAYSTPFDNPFRENFFPGIKIEPDGLSLRLPATLTITPSSHKFSPGERIFYLKNPGLAIPLWQSQLTSTNITGKISHFSEYIGGSPGSEEAQSQATAASELGGDFPVGWNDSLEGNQAMSEWGNGLNDMGLGDQGSGLLDDASDLLTQYMECMVDPSCLPEPEDPCGEYQTEIMLYYQQAILLGFDSESALMQSFSNLVQKVLNQCTNRYTLVFNHNLSINQMGIQQNNLVTGEVIFTAPIYGAGDIGPITMEGSGTVEVIISGQADKGDEVCVFSGSGTNAVKITGELVADEMGTPSISLEVNEQWYTSGNLTLTCPDDDPQSAPLPALPNQKITLEFPYHDGAQITEPNIGGLEGEYNWTLHILHSW
jgi:hypothetical protein